MGTATKDRILDAALKRFNRKGVAPITLRQIAEAANMSQGNLNYHFKTKQDIVEALHERLLEAAQHKHAALLRDGVTLASLLASIREGFEVLYDFRFFMRDLNWIMREYKRLHAVFLEVEGIRRGMYERVFRDAIDAGLMRPPEWSEEYQSLITRIRVFSDYWLSSAEIYDHGGRQAIVDHYAALFRDMLYPYLTVPGRAELRASLEAAST